MKNGKLNKLAWFYVLLFIISSGAQAQINLTGSISDAKNGEALIGAYVVYQGTIIGTSTNVNGQFDLDVPSDTGSLVFSFIGYTAQTVSIGSTRNFSIALVPGNQLDEVIVVGYGTAHIKDLTGSVTSVSAKDFTIGNIGSPEQLVAGKISGVNITSNSGAPGSGSRIRIRGGSSLNASNDPLIVIDGVPVDNNGIAGSANALNMMNSAEIENITVLKDASAAAIYGSRAANGVILISTKKGVAGNKLQINYSNVTSVSQNTRFVDVLTANEFRTLVKDTGSNNQISLLDTLNSTNWQSQIYRTGISSQNNLTFAGGIKGLPYRLNMEYFKNQGVLKRSQLNRYGLNLNLSPSLLHDQIQIDASAKMTHTQNFFADQGAIGAAVTFDPTKPVYSDSAHLYGGYYEWVMAGSGKPNVLAPKNPVGLIMQKDDVSQINRFIGSSKFDYKIPFLDGLHAILNLGMDYSSSNGYVKIPETAASSFYRHGVDNVYSQIKSNRLLEFYGNYKKDLSGIDSKLDLTGGYSYQNWLTKSPAQADINALGDTITPPGIPFETENTLISFYGRVNYSLKGKYLITATLRDDGSSRFSPSTRWGLFPSVAAAWYVSDEPFMKNTHMYLKLRAGYGVTGQQDIGNDYPYIPNYSPGTETAQYQFGDKFYTVLRPDGYDSEIKWEQTASTNIGLDLGFMNNRVSATLDFYRKLTSDLLAIVPVPAGTNFTNRIFTNVGNLQNTGVEMTLSAVIINNNDTRLEIGANASLNNNMITRLTKTQNPDDPGILIGGIPGGIGNTVQIHAVGFPAYSYLVYKQLYDENGMPIEGAYEDLNGDSTITPGRSDLGLGDQYIFNGSPEPKVFAGLFGNLNYKQWSFGLSMRSEFGAYRYNAVAAQRGYFKAIEGSKKYLNNLTNDYYKSQFYKGNITQFLSDYYLEKANFLRLDYFSMGYNFPSIANRFSLKVSAVVQNAFVFSNYSGIDPEVVGGIDNTIYPRPRIYSLNVNITL